MTMICQLSCLYSVFLPPDKQRLYDQGEIEAQSSFELVNRMKASEMSQLIGTYWVVVSCATTHEHSRMLNVTLTLFVWGFVLLQNLQDLGNKVCLRGLYVGQCWTWTVYDYHWPCQWFQIMDFGRHFVDWSQVRQLRLGHVSSIVNCMWLRCLGYVCLQVLYWLCFQPDE